MSALILSIALTYAQIALALAACFALWRVLRGPRAQDRTLGLDVIYACVLLLLLVTGIRMGNAFMFEPALIIATMSFVSTVAMAKFLLRGEVIE